MLSTLHKIQHLCFCAVLRWSFYTEGEDIYIFKIDDIASFLQRIVELSEIEEKEINLSV